MNRHLFVLNPAAGRKDLTEELQQNISDLSLDGAVDVIVTTCKGCAEAEVKAYLQNHTEEFTRVYACGGDGTVFEVANGMFHSGNTNCALGIVPVGSGNDFIKSFDISPESFRDLRALTQGEIAIIDALSARDGKGTQRISLNIISAGFDAAVAKGQEKFKKLPFVNGSLAYKMSLVKQLFSNLKNFFTVLADGERFGRTGDGPYLFVIAANGRYYGGGFKASPFSDLNDGMLDLIRIDTVSRPRFLSLVGKFRKGEYIHENEDIVNYVQCRKMQIVAENEVDLNLDGEIYPMNNPIVEIIPKAIKLILPKTDV